MTGTGPTTTVNQVGQMKQLVDLVARAWIDVQEMHNNWSFLWALFSKDTTQGIQTYQLATDGNYYLGDTFRIDGYPIDVIDYRDHVAAYGLSPPPPPGDVDDVTAESNDKPTYITERPDGLHLCVPTPDAVYTLTGEYYTKPVPFSSNSSVPAIDDASFNQPNAILERTKVLYAEFLEDDQMLRDGERGFQRAILQLRKKYLPELRWGATALA